MEEMQKEEGLNLLEIIRILFHKLKLLILVVIIAAAGGAFLGYGRYVNVKNYGTKIDFHVNPVKDGQPGVYGSYGIHIMDTMVKLLESEWFCEKLMLNGEVLPCVDIDKAKAPNDYYPNLDEKKHSKATRLLEVAEQYWESAENKTQQRDKAFENFKKEWIEQMESSLPSDYEEAYLKLPDIIKNSSEFRNLENYYNILITVEKELETATKKARDAQKEADEAVEIFLEEWRQSEKYITTSKKIKSALSYSYLSETDDIEDASKLTRSFIYVEINVLNDEEFAKDLLERVKVIIPAYIEDKMLLPDGYDETDCWRTTTRNEIQWLNPNLARNQAIKYAFLLAAAAGVIAALIVIIIDVQDKRLRDHEVITKKFKVPVLGIVPTIEEMNQAVELKKQELKKQKRGMK